MGSRSLFRCTQCGHEADVCGGFQRGMFAVLRTKHCRDCEEVVDVLVGAYGEEGPIMDPEFERRRGRCPNCDGQRLARWRAPHPCPKCRAPMARLGPTILWD